MCRARLAERTTPRPWAIGYGFWKGAVRLSVLAVACGQLLSDWLYLCANSLAATGSDQCHPEDFMMRKSQNWWYCMAPMYMCTRCGRSASPARPGRSHISDSLIRVSAQKVSSSP